jgi:hypothetical protein
MKKQNNIKRFSLPLLLFAMLVLTATAQQSPAQPQIWTTDVDGNLVTDYAPTDTIYIKGSGFDPDSVIIVRVEGPDGWFINLEPDAEPDVDVFSNIEPYEYVPSWTFDEDGIFTIEYIKGWCDGTFYVTMWDENLNLLASTTFTDKNAGVSGYVLDSVTSLPIEGAIVSNNLDTDTATTISSGYYSIPTINWGSGSPTLTLTASKTGYTDNSISFSVTNGENYTNKNIYLTPSKLDQTITFGALANKTYGDAPFNISATSSSGLPVSFAITEGGAYASLSGNTVTILGATPLGSYVEITAYQDGDDDYNPAPDVSRSFTIAKADAVITVTGFSGTYDGEQHGVISSSAVGVESPTPADLSSLLHIATTTYTDVPGGSVHWTFDGNTNYNPASGDATVTINKADAIITVTGFSGTYDGNPHGVIYSSAVGVESPTPADLNGLLHITATTWTDVPGGLVHWTFDGNTNYNSTSGDVTVTITQAHTELVLTVNPAVVVAGNPFNVQATLSSSDSPTLDLSGMTITFTIDPDSDGSAGPVPLDSGSAVTDGSGVANLNNISTFGWLGAVYEITADYAGDDNIVGDSDDVTIVVADPGAAATGGGFITNNGRTNFGFTVKMVEGITNTYKGQFVIVNKSKWRMKGTLNSYGILDDVGYASGSGKLYSSELDSFGIRYWDLVESDVSIILRFTDTYNGSGTGHGKKTTIVLDTFGIDISYPFSSSNPNTPRQDLKGGNIDIKSANNTTDGDPATPPAPGKGKNK